MKGSRIVEGKREGRHYAAEHHNEGHNAQHREALQLERVTLIETFQLIVLEAQRIERSAARRLDGMVHAVAVAAAAPSAAASCVGGAKFKGCKGRKRERDIYKLVSSVALATLKALHVRFSKMFWHFFVARNHWVGKSEFCHAPYLNQWTLRSALCPLSHHLK